MKKKEEPRDKILVDALEKLRKTKKIKGGVTLYSLFLYAYIWAAHSEEGDVNETSPSFYANLTYEQYKNEQRGVPEEVGNFCLDLLSGQIDLEELKRLTNRNASKSSA